jgi:pyruvate formate lyase activating enzyme
MTIRVHGFVVFMAKCRICGSTSIVISSVIGLCVNCIRSGARLGPDPHLASRSRFKLQLYMESGEYKCTVCGRNCGINKNSRGFCNYRGWSGGGVEYSTGSPEVAVGLYYYDPHPTNCVAFPICPAITGRGYPEYALTPHGERGYYNIAVFYGGCNMDCLYCQNWEYRDMARRASPRLSIEQLVDAVNRRTTCVCFFGGDPGPFAPHALLASKKMIARARDIGLGVFRVCWETNGLWNPLLLEEAARLSLNTGGIVKIDFKAWSPEVYSVLCGIGEKHVRVIRDNIKLVAKYYELRRDPPLLLLSTLLVPGYVDEYEVDQMTKYIAGINPDIPYVFLGFHPDYMLLDLPTTSRNHVEKAVKIARENGLRNIHVGNVFLLGSDY